MPTELITPDEFLARLTKCFAEPSSKGSIWLTHKRHRSGGEGNDKMDVDDDSGPSGSGPSFEVLLRCTQKGGSKFSTRIPSTSLPSFHARYGSLLKASMAPQMRKRDKKKEKARMEAAAKKRKELYVDVELGSKGKRGAGRRQRQRRVKAQLRKEADRERAETRVGQIVSSGAPLER